MAEREELELEGYCLKCREKRVMQDPQAEYSASGSPGTRGTCPVCEGTIYKMGYTPLHEGLPKPKVTRKRKKAEEKRSGRLVIVESPAKARTIGKYLGRGYKVRSSVGHVRDLLKSRLSVDVDNGFAPEYRVPNEKRDTVKELKQAAAGAEEIYLATDPDREGEAIAWHVQEAAAMEPERTRRVVFQEITKPAIQAAFQQPREIDMDRVDAQQARRILDRLVGYKLSPLLWRKVRGRLSAGRVQSVAVRLVVEREREIEAFEPEEYWSLQAELSQEDFRGQEPRPFFTARFHKYKGEDPELPSEEVVQKHLEALEPAQWTVGEVRLGQRRRKPAAPFTTSTMQQEASRQIRFGTNKTMRIAQQLYEGVDLGDEGTEGLITYMRTDSVAVSKDAQAETRDFIAEEWGTEYRPSSPRQHTTKSKLAQEAHEAIRPTSVRRVPESIKQHLSRDQYRLYDLIWKRFVASQMSNAVYDTVSVDIYAGEAKTAIAERPYLFRATGSTLRFPGFLVLYEETEPEDRPEDAEVEVPTDLEEGERLDLLQLVPNQHFTQPPPRFSEATLVKELEQNGIGRPSTYASIISTIVSRGYVKMEDRRLVPTETGEVVNDLLVAYFPNVMSVDFTARMEDELDEIAEGRQEWVPVVRDFYDGFAENLSVAEEDMPKVEMTEKVGRACPECGGDLLYRHGRYGRFIGCANFPECRYTEQILEKIGIDCPECGGDIVVKKTRRGRTFYGCANYPDCEWTNWKRPVPQKCENCGGLMVQANKRQAECTKCGERAPLEIMEAQRA
ncbi:MAG: type I DNA topoisomerase [Candidatus Promineifilaceae bacterium]|nr:type I DNA topoisomerase [Candidatus Promineifilaceae bacterium]